MRSSQVCSALQRFQRFGLPPAAALLQPLSRVAALLCGGFAACKTQKIGPKKGRFPLRKTAFLFS
ncbi:hypothetical protein SGRA_1300 [Saprospira grandis str. Lewin]|uniref:Uncharacterized protein n=1 Tax=Saprospira grandis (strain Lewin) TaxID=984262 RepID=H6L5C1_SAPGL|nr:hypothetical protein SGRA_1300 [Saprospira grandis str. Lewin]